MAGVRHHDLHRDVRAGRAHGRDQPRPGLPRRGRAGRGPGGRRARAARRAQPVRAAAGRAGAARGDRRPPAPLLRDRGRPGPRGAGHVRRHGGDRGRAAGDLRAGRRRRLPGALLRLLRGRDRDGRRQPPPGHAAPAGLGDRPRRARRGDHAPRAGAAAQLAAQPDRQGALAPGARADRRRLPRARPDRDHRRGLRAPRLRRRAHPARDAAGDGRAHADDLLAGQDVLGDGLEDGLGGRPARARRRHAHGQAVPDVRGRDAVPARGRGGARARRRGLRARSRASCASSATTCARASRPPGWRCSSPPAPTSRTSTAAATASRSAASSSSARASWRSRRASSTTTRRRAARSCGSRSASGRPSSTRPPAGSPSAG